MTEDYLTIKDYKERIDFLIKNKSEIIEMKKNAIKHTDYADLNCMDIGNVLKGMNENSDTDKTIKRTIIGNTYNWADSHGDVHLDNVFKKSIGERVGKIWHLHDHEQKITSKVGKPIDVYEKRIAWRELGIDKAGSTMALFMDSEIKRDYNSMVFDEYKSGEINQHSVGMYYVKIALAVNDPDQKEEFAVWQKYIDSIGNKEVVEKRGYFFAVAEAKLIEISAVLQGSNELTPTLNPKNEIEPSNDTQNEPSDKDTQHNQNKPVEGAKSSLFYY
jgi:hypothetical protein